MSPLGRIAAALLVLTLLVVAAPAGADESLKTLGTDASGDAPPGSDLTSLAVGRSGDDLRVVIEIMLLPGLGGNPEAGIQWSFRSGSRSYAVEAHQDGPGDYHFTLYDTRGGVFSQIARVDGTTDTTAGSFDLLIPLKLIKAKTGTKIEGAPLASGVGDVEVHQHSPVTSDILDDLTTTKSYKIK